METKATYLLVYEKKNGYRIQRYSSCHELLLVDCDEKL
jgi:hypothetical protein